MGIQYGVLQKKSPVVANEAFGNPIGSVNYLTKCLNSAPARNFGAQAAGILIVFPVCGLRPIRALRLALVKVPKPTNLTSSPFFTVFLTLVIKQSTMCSHCAFGIFVSNAIFSINCALFMSFSFVRRLALLERGVVVVTSCCRSSSLISISENKNKLSSSGRLK
jgi:hypothetical protein